MDDKARCPCRLICQVISESSHNNMTETHCGQLRAPTWHSTGLRGLANVGSLIGTCSLQSYALFLVHPTMLFVHMLKPHRHRYSCASYTKSLLQTNTLAMSLIDLLQAGIAGFTSHEFLVAAFCMGISYMICNAVYQLYFSPLSAFPGPKIAAFTLWYEIYYDVFKWGQYYIQVQKMHEKYGTESHAPFSQSHQLQMTSWASNRNQPTTCEANGLSAIT